MEGARSSGNNCLFDCSTNAESVLISACLLGIPCRWHGRRPKRREKLIERLKKRYVLVPVCPEQLGGLPTPRVGADLVGGDGHDVLAGNARVITRSGEDVTRNFILGANQVLKIARQLEVTKLFLKAGSPSCGIKPNIGVTAALLKQTGFEVVEMD